MLLCFAAGYTPCILLYCWGFSTKMSPLSYYALKDALGYVRFHTRLSHASHSVSVEYNAVRAMAAAPTFSPTSSLAPLLLGTNVLQEVTCEVNTCRQRQARSGLIDSSTVTLPPSIIYYLDYTPSRFTVGSQPLYPLYQPKHMLVDVTQRAVASCHHGRQHPILEG